MPEIACLGILVADLVGRPIDALPQRGRLALVERMELHIGGCAANTGLALSKLGVRTAVLGKVGTDGLGEFVVQTMMIGGVDTQGLVRDAEVGTACTMVLVGSDGERTFLHHLGGNAAYHSEDIRWDVVNKCRFLHVAGALVMPGLDGPPMANVLRTAKMRKIKTSLDTVWDATGKWMQTLAPCLPYVDYFLPSLSEAQELTGRSEPREIACALRDAGVGTVGLKLGERGCYIQSSKCELAIPSFKVEAVDGTGSGDAWVAGFLCGVSKGWDLERAGRFANAVGALSVTSLGATDGIRSLKDTEAFMSQPSESNA